MIGDDVALVDVPAVRRGGGGAKPGVALGAGLMTALIGALGVTLGLAAVFGHVRGVDVGWLVPLLGVQLAFDPLGGFFMIITGAVAIPVGVYTIGYLRQHRLPGVGLIVLPVFVIAMLLVAAAGSIPSFLLGWELMALTSLVLVLSEYREARVRAAALLYAILTQLGFLALLVALMVWSASAGGDSFALLAARTGALPASTRAVVLVLTVVGFGSKCGLIPLHAWLPRAHPEAPSPVSALMSAAMVNLGVYGLLRFDLQLLTAHERWFGVVLIIVGGLSALYGVLQAATGTDLKQLLAYSTIENMGLIVLGIGASVLLHASGLSRLATVAVVAAVLHVVAHAAFKTLAFLAAGSVQASTGLRDLDRMGGLAQRMPGTTVCFGIAALGACGLPLGAGFVSEWLLIQSLVHAPRGADSALALTLPAAVGVVALCTGLAVAAMVKAFGVGFLARARSAEAADAHEAPRSMLAAMGGVAVVCGLLAIAPGVLSQLLRRVAAALPQTQVVGVPRFGAWVRLPGVASSISPISLLVGVVIACGVTAAFAAARRARPRPVARPVWACGADSITARMQYTATSFAEPLQRVFEDVLRPETDVEITHHAESAYLVEKVAYRVRIADTLEERLYRPVVVAVVAVAALVRRVHNGSVHLYLGYGALGLLVVLLVAR